MRLCFVVNSVRTQRATYTTLHLAFAAHRRGHDVAFVSVDALSHDGTHVWGALVRPPAGGPSRGGGARAPPRGTDRERAGLHEGAGGQRRAPRGGPPRRLRRRVP